MSSRATGHARIRTLPAGLVAGIACLGFGVAPAVGAVRSGSLDGHVTAAAPGGVSATVPVAGVTVTVTGPTGATYATATTADGFYALDGLPAPGLYSVTFASPAGGQSQTKLGVAVPPAGIATTDDTLTGPVATITGQLATRRGRPLEGIPVGVTPAGLTTCQAGEICGPSTTTDVNGQYAINLAAGSYEVEAEDGSRLIDVQAVDATAGEVSTVNVTLPVAAVPAGTQARHATRDLQWLNAERTRDGLPAGVALNPRWSADCAAHDAYEEENGVLSGTENPQAPGASVGGAWAGLTSVLAESRWTPRADPWETAPIHLLQLLSPSLSVVGIDDSGGHQCVTTYPGLVRAPVTTDTLTTYPAAGAHGVPARENARESPFVPGQFAGIPAGRTAGRELFVYLNLAGETGQSPVQIIRATLSRGRHPVAVRSVDSSTPTLGAYLTGGILIPVVPLRRHTTYRASVMVRDRSGSISHSWSFTTARG